MLRRERRGSISIHAPRGGSDGRGGLPEIGDIDFNPRSPWGERRAFIVLAPPYCNDFNPRSPWGERRRSRRIDLEMVRYFNPRSPWGERLHPHMQSLPALLFQSTLPVGGATRTPASFLLRYSISIHAPRGGSDGDASFDPDFTSAISIHAPRGGSDLITVTGGSTDFIFQSTLPVGGATAMSEFVARMQAISIHAPRGGSDIIGIQLAQTLHISIHAPRGGSDVPKNPVHP